MEAKTLLEKVNKVLESEGVAASQLTNEEKLYDFIFPGIENAKSTLSSLHKNKKKKGNSPIGKIKSFILKRVRNIVINTVEAESMKQQKFNDMTYQALVILQEENKKLQAELKELQKKDSNDR